MPENNSNSYDPTEKVERMNRIFDRLVLPIIAFTVVMFIVTAIIIRPESCVRDYTDTLTPVEDIQSEPDAYLMREVLLEDMEKNRPVFEQSGYTVIETEQSGFVAWRQLDEYTQIFDNIADSSGSRYSAVVYEKDGTAVTVRIYSESIFLVEAASGENSASAIFRDDSFATWTSGSDADAAAVQNIISAQQLEQLTEMYKQSILAIIE